MNPHPRHPLKTYSISPPHPASFSLSPKTCLPHVLLKRHPATRFAVPLGSFPRGRSSPLLPPLFSPHVLVIFLSDLSSIVFFLLLTRPSLCIHFYILGLSTLFPLSELNAIVYFHNSLTLSNCLLFL